MVMGARLRLRPLTVADCAGPYLGWMNDPEVVRLTAARGGHFTADDLAAYIAARNASADEVFLAIELIEGGRHIGNIKLGPIDGEKAAGRIGIIIGEKDCWGQGYATEAIDLMACHAFQVLGLAIVDAAIYDGNEGSLRAFRKAGFSLEQTNKGAVEVAGRFLDEHVVVRRA